MQGHQVPIQTIQNNTVNVRYIPAALELNVTPQITAGGDIICNIQIRNNSADWSNYRENVGVPIITQSLDTTVRVNDGGTIVIGGLYRVEDSKSRQMTPLLSKIPLIGNLFKSISTQRAQKETLIFITPRIVK
jgi:type IV pilus assembly protein PilQ